MSGPDDGAADDRTPPANSSGEGTPEPSAMDDIFHDSQFAEVDDEQLIPAVPARRGREPRAPREPREPREPRAGWEFTKQQRLLLWIAGGALAIIVLLILFLVGIKTAPNTVSLPVVTPKPSVSVTPSITPTATPTVAATGPAAAGVHKWTELQGGECLQPFESVWAESFTVVDCATPHAAQLVYRAVFPGAEDAAVPYPGVAALQAQINLLCTAPGVIDLTAAGAYTDVQFQASYAATSKEWTKGNHTYSCFVSRSSGEPMTATLATVH